MNAPDHDPFAFDARLRAHYDEVAQTPPTPPVRVWQGLQAQLQPAAPVPAPRRAPLLAGASGLVLGVLLMLLVGWWEAKPVRQAEPRRPAVARTMGQSPKSAASAVPAGLSSETATTAPPSATIESASAQAILETAPATLTSRTAISEPTIPASASVAALSGSAPATSGLPAASTAEPISPAVPAALLALVETETTLAALATDTARTTRESRRAALLTEQTELARLTHRTDSLLRALDGAAIALSPPVVTDSIVPEPPRNRWSVALSFAPERNFFGLSSAPADTLSALRRTHEQGRAGFNAAVAAEYRLNQRWSVGAGLGLTSYGAELRLTDRQTTVSVAYDTQTSHATQTTHIEYQTYSLRDDSTIVLSPVYNSNQQIIDFDTLYVPRLDTIWRYNSTDGTVETTTVTTTPTVTTRQEVSTRILRPNYRFLSVPLFVRYRLGTDGGTFGGPAASRWWADVALGAQLQLFLGGTQLVSADGRHWRTERVGMSGGPFRPLTIALTGSLALNYALTPRLSASVAPTLRYQTESVYKASTGLTQRPAATGVQMGLRFAF